MSFLLGYDSDVVRDVLYRTGVPANFELNERERFSHRIRSSAYDQRFRRAYNELDDNQKYRASYIIAERLVAIGASIKDAGRKAFLISEAEDPDNRTALMTQATQTWTAANAYIISAG